MPSRASLGYFLATARMALTETRTPSFKARPIVLVVGNESADLDSLCSALILAYLRTYGSPTGMHVPVANIARADFALRPEFTAVLKQAGVEPEEMPALDDLLRAPFDEGVPALLRPEDTQWLLVDHNALTGPLAKAYGERVVGCIDHHVDEGSVPPSSGGDGDVPRVIEKSGSCASLVVRECRERWAALGGGTDREDHGDPSKDPARVDAQLAQIALAPVLIDTINMTDPDKVMPADETATALLVDLINKDPERTEPFDQKAFYDHIAAVKEDLSGLTLRDMFRKDYKQWGEGNLLLGVCCVAQGLEWQLAKTKDTKLYYEALRSWAGERALDIVAVMTTSHPDGQFKRELLVWALNAQAVRSVRRFVEMSGAALGLERWGDGRLDDDAGGEDELRSAWDQKDLSSSRKKVGPRLRDAMKSVAD